MKIEITYDPVRPYTFVRIDGRAVSRSDIYGFLYPVRGYVLQTWLEPSGSWRGLKSELTDLTREEPSRILFRGREVDYADVEKALRGLKNGECAFEPADTAAASERILEEAERCFERIVSAAVVMERDETPITRSLAGLFPEQAARIREWTEQPEREWLSEINSREDLSRCLREDGCCLINGDELLSYDNYGMIDALMTGLRRAPDMIVCAFSSEEKKAEFMNFNAQYKNHPLTFIRAGETAWRETLREKYGRPWECRQRLERLKRCREALEACFRPAEGREETASVAGQIRDALEQRYRKRWAIHQKNQMDRLTGLLAGSGDPTEGGDGRE